MENISKRPPVEAVPSSIEDEEGSSVIDLQAERAKRGLEAVSERGTVTAAAMEAADKAAQGEGDADAGRAKWEARVAERAAA